ncbi:MBL fold metallo-hydrolase [Granulicella cerasi]|uniref:MBL fold metallo-hydrolase n=1 Tax=Granulicella cerasi TaxID=741063 RepID=UPI0021DF43A9|nr:MBL fold metallo-hydrolase [Granulicella cerasi]
MRASAQTQTAAWTRSLRLFFCLCAIAATAHAQKLTITLVGTGGPELTPDRSGIATLVRSGDDTLLIDAGRNTLDNLYRAGIDPNTVKTLLLTHLHSDHISGLPDLWITPWFLLHRTGGLTIYGPRGTQQMVNGMRAMYTHDLVARANPTALVRDLDIHVIELEDAADFQINGFSVRAKTVQHADGNPAFAFLIRNGSHSVFLTGDCTLTPELLQAAPRVDVLIANVAAGTPAQEGLAQWKPVFAKLLTVAQAAQLFSASKPGLAVYSHIVTKGRVPDATLIERTRKAGYQGRLLVGRDATRITLDHGIDVRRNPAPTGSEDGVRR